MLGITATCADSGYIGQNEFVLHGDFHGKVQQQEQGNSFGGILYSVYFKLLFFIHARPRTT